MISTKTSTAVSTNLGKKPMWEVFGHTLGMHDEWIQVDIRSLHSVIDRYSRISVGNRICIRAQTRYTGWNLFKPFKWARPHNKSGTKSGRKENGPQGSPKTIGPISTTNQ